MFANTSYTFTNDLINKLIKRRLDNSKIICEIFDSQGNLSFTELISELNRQNSEGGLTLQEAAIEIIRDKEFVGSKLVPKILYSPISKNLCYFDIDNVLKQVSYVVNDGCLILTCTDKPAIVSLYEFNCKYYNVSALFRLFNFLYSIEFI